MIGVLGGVTKQKFLRIVLDFVGGYPVFCWMTMVYEVLFC